MSFDARTANERPQQAASPRGIGAWAQAHAGFLRAILLIAAYCSAVISLISMIAFRGVQTVAVLAGTICIASVAAVFLLPRKRGPAR